MAKKDESTNLIDEFKSFKELKGIDQTTIINVLEESFRSVIAKMFGGDDNFDVIVNPDKGDCEIYQNLEVVEDGAVEDANKQVGLTEARQIDPECEVGEEVTRIINFAKFGRRAILNLRQTLASKILDLQKDAIYSKFKDLEGELITAEVYQLWKKEILLVDADNNELILPKDQQIPKDFYRKGDQVRAIVYCVDNKNNNPKVYVSRTSDEFLRRLRTKSGRIGNDDRPILFSVAGEERSVLHFKGGKIEIVNDIVIHLFPRKPAANLGKTVRNRARFVGRHPHVF